MNARTYERAAHVAMQRSQRTGTRSNDWPPPHGPRRCYICYDHVSHSGTGPCVCCRLNLPQRAEAVQAPHV
jgi:hypothetical protein